MRFNDIKQRIYTGWSFIRGLYLVMGAIIIIQAIYSGQWPGILLGGYFAAMGILGFGCAGGNCYGGSCAVDRTRQGETSEHKQ